MSLKAFRLFISSTFADFAGEREALHNKVFPALERYCLERGYQFHPIDLRWGVSEEAQLDQKTVALCLNAVKASKKFPPPNFLIMLGNRYGWVPMPYAIERGEFEAICQAIERNGNAKAAEIIENLRKLYVLDANHLVERIPGEMVPAHILIHRQGALADQQKWQAIESFYRPHLQKAADRLFQEGQLDTPDRDKYFSSLTEQEIYHGLGEMDEGHSFAFLRDITGGAAETAPVFIEDNPQLDRMKAYIKETLPPANIYSANAAFRRDAKSPSLDERHLTGFVEKVEAFLKASIDAYIKQVDETEQVPDHELITERSQHEKFRNEKLKIFFGREDTLRVIDEYRDAPGNAPLIIHGRSGMGKSALMAKAIKAAQDRQTVPVIYRFVGASAASSDIRSLLISLIEDLATHGLVLMPDEFETDINKFNSQISELLSSITEPVAIFIDGLDQLQKQDFLNWLPAELPSAAKLVLSVLHDEDYPDASQYYHILTRKYALNDFVKLKGLGPEHGARMLAALLDEEKRQLQPEQACYVLEKFEAAGASPLYLKTAFEIAKSWHGWDEMGDEPGQKFLAADVPTLIVQFLSELVSEHHHDSLLIARVLGYLAAACFGLSEKEMTDILSRDDEVMAAVANKYHENKSDKLPPSVWTRLHDHLAPFLVEKQMDGQPLLSFFHRQISDVITTRYYEAEKQLLHDKLAAYFESLNQDEGERTRYNIRALSELPYQFHASGHVENLKVILLDPAFMEDKLATHGVQPLIKDYQLYGDEAGPAAKLTGQTLILADNILSSDPRQLLPQILGRMSSDMADGVGEMLHEARQMIKPPVLIPRCPTLILAGGPKIRHFEGCQDWITSVAFSPDGKSIATGSNEKGIRIWDVVSGKSSLFESDDEIDQVVYSPDGLTLASCSQDGSLQLWDSVSGKKRKFLGLTDEAIGYDMDGRKVIQSFADGSIWILDTEKNSIISRKAGGVFKKKNIETRDYEKLSNDTSSHIDRMLTGVDDNRGIAFSQDGRKIVTSSESGVTRLWDVSEGKICRIFGLKGCGNSIAFSPDGQHIACGAPSAGTIAVWNIRSGEYRELEGQKKITNAIAFSPDGRKLASGSWDKILRLWDLDSGEFVEFTGHSGGIEDIAFSPDGKTIVTGSDDKTIRLWNVASGEARVLEGHIEGVYAVAFSSDGRTIVSGSKDKMLYLWDVRNKNSPTSPHKGAVDAISISPNNKTIVTGSTDNRLKLWNLEGLKFIREFEGHVGTIRSVDFSPDGRTIVSGSEDRTLRLWDISSVNTRQLETLDFWVRRVAFSPDGKSVVYYSGEEDGPDALYLWDLASSTSRALIGHTNRVTSVAFSPNGSIVASGAKDKTIRLWNVRSWRFSLPLFQKRSLSLIRWLFRGQSRVLHCADWVRGICFSGDGETIVSSVNDQPLQLWDVLSGKSKNLKFLSAPAFPINLNSDGRKLIAVYENENRIGILDIVTDEVLSCFDNDVNMSSIDIAHDGSCLAVGDFSGRVHILDIILTEDDKVCWLRRFNENSQLPSHKEK